MASPAAQAVAQAVIAEVGRGRRPKLTELAIKAGYSPESARAGKATRTKAYKETMAPLLERLKQERDAIIKEMALKRSKAKYRDLVDGLDKVTKTMRLLDGESTENVAQITKVEISFKK